MGAPPADRAETAPQALEKMESAPDKSALPHAFEAAPPAAEPARSVRADDLEAGPPNDALPPAAEPPHAIPRPLRPAPARKRRRKRLKTWFRARKRQDPARRRAGRGAVPARRRLCARRRYAGASPTAGEPIERPPMEWPGIHGCGFGPRPRRSRGLQADEDPASPQWRGGLCRRGLNMTVGRPSPGSISGTGDNRRSTGRTAGGGRSFRRSRASRQRRPSRP